MDRKTLGMSQSDIKIKKLTFIRPHVISKLTFYCGTQKKIFGTKN